MLFSLIEQIDVVHSLRADVMEIGLDIAYGYSCLTVLEQGQNLGRGHHTAVKCDYERYYEVRRSYNRGYRLDL